MKTSKTPETDKYTKNLVSEIKKDLIFSDEEEELVLSVVRMTTKLLLKKYDETLKELGIDCSSCKCGNAEGCCDMCIMMNEVIVDDEEE